MDLRRFKPSPGSLGALAVGGAWFFIVISLLHVSWAITGMWSGDSLGTYSVYHTVVGDVSYDAWALTYTGIVGLLIAIVQLLVVSSAAVTSTLPFDRTVKARHAGHMVLCGWSALWALNLVRLALIDGGLDSIAQSVLLSGLFVCTVWRASSGWSPRRSKPTAEPLADEPLRAEPTLNAAAPDEPDAPAEPADCPVPDAVEKESFSVLVAAALGKLARSVQTIVLWVLAVLPRLRQGGRVARRRAAGGLNRVADFTRRQASRVAPNTGKAE